MSERSNDGLPVITSRKNDRLRLVRALRSRRGRRMRGRFLLEGPKAIAELLEQDASRVEQLLYRDQPTLLGPVRQALEAAKRAQVAAFPVAAELFDELAPSETPQGLLAVAPLRWTPLEELLAGEDLGAPRALVACLGVQDPGNLGTIARSARFFGFAGLVVLPGTQDPWSPKVVRSAAGALLAQPPAQAEDLGELLRAAAAAQLEPRALAAHEGKPLGRAPLPARCLLLLGAEGQGLPEGAGELPALTIEGAPGAESLNVAVAFAVAAHAWRGGAR